MAVSRIHQFEPHTHNTHMMWHNVGPNARYIYTSCAIWAWKWHLKSDKSHWHTTNSRRHILDSNNCFNLNTVKSRLNAPVSTSFNLSLARYSQHILSSFTWFSNIIWFFIVLQQTLLTINTKKDSCNTCRMYTMLGIHPRVNCSLLTIKRCILCVQCNIKHYIFSQDSSIIGWFDMQTLMKSFYMESITWKWCNSNALNGLQSIVSICHFFVLFAVSLVNLIFTWEILILHRILAIFQEYNHFHPLLLVKIVNSGDLSNKNDSSNHESKCARIYLWKYPLIGCKRFRMNMNCIICSCQRLHVQSNHRKYDFTLNCWCKWRCIDETVCHAWAKSANNFDDAQNTNLIKPSLIFILILCFKCEWHPLRSSSHFFFFFSSQFVILFLHISILLHSDCKLSRARIIAIKIVLNNFIRASSVTFSAHVFFSVCFNLTSKFLRT